MSAQDDGIKCSKCKSRMEAGFVPDFAHGTVLLPKWRSGPPKHTTFLGIYSGIRVKREEGLAITAWRCPRCALVEFYAPDKATF